MFERCLYFNLNALARRINRLWEEGFRELGVSAPQGYLLRAVIERPGINHKALGELLVLEKSTVTRFVTALEKRGLVRREPAGGREIGVYPSEEALRMSEELEAIVKRLSKSLRKRLGKKESRELVHQLRAAAEVMEAE